jgi:hypothetical protein
MENILKQAGGEGCPNKLECNQIVHIGSTDNIKVKVKMIQLCPANFIKNTSSDVETTITNTGVPGKDYPDFKYLTMLKNKDIDLQYQFYKTFGEKYEYWIMALIFLIIVFSGFVLFGTISGIAYMFDDDDDDDDELIINN